MLRPLYGLVALVILSTACQHAVEINPSPKIPTASRWTATLASPSNLAGVVQIRGYAWMAPATTMDSARTLTTIQISNAGSGGVHPWAVHLGQCGNDGGILGSERAYPLLRVGGNGVAVATVTQAVPSPRSGSYFVEVLASPANTATVIACGNMAAPSA
jgi:hypothetical protein